MKTQKFGVIWIYGSFWMCLQPLELAGTYTFEGAENDVCTIRVEARRSTSDMPIGAPPATGSQRVRLAGGYRATMKVDQATGSRIQSLT